MKFTGPAQYALKCSFLGVCAWAAFGGHHPPVEAQERQTVVPVMTVEDAVQDNNITALNKHIEATDANNTRNWQATQKNAADIAGMQGEERGIGAFLALLSGTGLILQVRSKKAA